MIYLRCCVLLRGDEEGILMCFLGATYPVLPLFLPVTNEMGSLAIIMPFLFPFI